MALSTNSSTLFDFSDNNFTIVAAGTHSPTALKLTGIETKIYPNPCNNILQVNLGDPSILPVSFEIMSVTGKMVMRQDIRESSNHDGMNINTSGFSDGFYIFVIRKSSEMVFRTALIIEH